MKRRIDDIDVHYEIDGPAGAPVVMLSHSLATTLAMWSPQLPMLARDFRVLRYDTRGHGETGAPATDYTLERLAEDAAGLLDALAIDRVHWVGISMGGMIGQTLALAHPQRIASLALCDTTSRVPAETGPAWEARIGAAQATGLAPLVETTIDRWFSPQFRERDPATVDAVREMIRRTPVAGYVGCCRAIMKLDLTDRLAEIHCPTLVVVGECDEGTPVAASETIQRGIAGARLVVLPGARHLSNIEAAAPFNAALREHLEGAR